MFQYPLGLLALLAVPAVVFLHLFRRRFRRRVVSALFLFDMEDRAAIAGRKREPLHRSASFWCEVLAALLLALAFAGPRACGAGASEHLVAVLDSSASMGARTTDGSLADKAIELVLERLETLPRGSRATLIASGTRPHILAGPAALLGEARAALAEFEPGAARHDLAPAAALAAQLSEAGSVIVITDHFDPDAWPQHVELVSVGEPASNLAITNAARRRARADEQSPSGAESVEEIALTVTNFATVPARARIMIAAQGAELERRSFELSPGAREHFRFRLPVGSPLLEARLSAESPFEDALAIDNAAYLAPAPPRTLALATTLSPDVARHLGMMSPGQEDSRVDRWTALLPDAVDAGDPLGAHLVVSADETPNNPGAWVLALESPASDRKNLIGPFLIDRRHPLLDGVTLEGIVWNAATEVTMPGSPLVSAGNLPLVTEDNSGDTRRFRFNIDPLLSSLHRSPDWPILLTNLAELRRAELPGPTRTSLAIGEAFVYRGHTPANYRFTEPSGGERTLRARSTLVVSDVTSPGVYTLFEESRVEPLTEVAFSFSDPVESDLRTLRPGRRPAESPLSAIRAGFSRAEIALLSLVLALALLDWLILARFGAAGRANGGSRGTRV